MSANIWKKCKLGSLGNAIIGLTYSPSNIVESGTLVLRSSNIQNECLSLEDNVYVNKKIPDEIRIKYNDILICVRNGSKALIGKSLLLKDECIGETFGAFMTVFRSEYAEYLTHVIKSSDIKRQIVRCTGATINQITNGDLRQFTLYFPTNKKERDNIARILSTCDTVIQNTQKTIDKYKSIKQGMMQDLFTRGLTKDGKLRPSYKEAPELYKESELGMIPKEWELKSLIEVATIIMGQSPKTESYNDKNGVPLIQGNADIKNRECIINGFTTSITKAGYPGDIIMTVRAPVGNVAHNNLNCCLGRGVCALRNTNEYLFHYLIFIENDWWKYSTGSTFDSINSQIFKKIFIRRPIDEKEQNEIAKRLSSIDSIIQKEETILEKYKNIKTGLMARLLTPPEDAEIIDETGE